MKETGKIKLVSAAIALLLWGTVPLSSQTLLPLLGAGGAGAPPPSVYTFVQYTFVPETATAATSVTTPAITLTAGDLVTVYCRGSIGAGGTIAFSSTPSNTWAALPPQLISATAPAQMAYTLSAGAGSTTFTCTFSASTTGYSVVVLQYHHSGSSAAFDVTTGAAVTGVGNPTSPAFTTTGAPGLVIQCATLSVQSVLWTAGTIDSATATLRGVSAALLTATGDAGCQDAKFATAQTGITATIDTNRTAVNGALTVGAFK